MSSPWQRVSACRLVLSFVRNAPYVANRSRVVIRPREGGARAALKLNALMGDCMIAPGLIIRGTRRHLKSMFELLSHDVMTFGGGRLSVLTLGESVTTGEDNIYRQRGSFIFIASPAF